jgi:hypothetical protein
MTMTELRRRIRAKLQWWSLVARGKALVASNRLLRRRITGDAPVIVSLTSHGDRVLRVHTTLESIARGQVRPRRVILWLNEVPGVLGEGQPLPPALQSLVRRGLEVRFCPNYGPHTKYFPALALARDQALPLVTADDDIVYPEWWLSRLLTVHQARPGVIWCYRARRVTFANDALAPYERWDSGPECTQPSILNFATGVSGVIYHAGMIESLIAAGEGFRDKCLRQDDIWLHYVAVMAGHEVAQVDPEPLHFDVVPHTDHLSLWHQNLGSSGNADAARLTYDALSLQKLAHESKAMNA